VSVNKNKMNTIKTKDYKRNKVPYDDKNKSY